MDKIEKIVEPLMFFEILGIIFLGICVSKYLTWSSNHFEQMEF